MNTGPSPAFSMGRLVLIALTLVWIGAAVAGFVLEKPLIHVAVVLFPLGVFFLQRPQWILIFALVATQGQLLVPGLPRGLNLAYLLLAGFLVLTLARTAILKSRVEKPTKFTRFTVWAFLAVMIFTAWRRGLGLLSLGGGASRQKAKPRT